MKSKLLLLNFYYKIKIQLKFIQKNNYMRIENLIPATMT